MTRVIHVTDTQRAYEGCNVLKIALTPSDKEFLSSVAIGAQVIGKVDPAFRRGVRQAHSATHLLHAALRTVLGSHIMQVRFDDDVSMFPFRSVALTPMSRLARRWSLVFSGSTTHTQPPSPPTRLTALRSNFFL